MIVAEKFEDFADAILKKMIIEIASNDPVAPSFRQPARRQPASQGRL
jgi:hypothetical protein